MNWINPSFPMLIVSCSILNFLKLNLENIKILKRFSEPNSNSQYVKSSDVISCQLSNAKIWDIFQIWIFMNHSNIDNVCKICDRFLWEIKMTKINESEDYFLLRNKDIAKMIDIWLVAGWVTLPPIQMTPPGSCPTNATMGPTWN